MKKIVLFVLVLFSSFILVNPSCSADEQNYDSKGSVGFTGSWTPQSSSPPESEPPSQVKNIATQKNLPNTGDTTRDSVGMSFMGSMLLLAIAVYKLNERKIKI